MEMNEYEKSLAKSTPLEPTEKLNSFLLSREASETEGEVLTKPEMNLVESVMDQSDQPSNPLFSIPEMDLPKEETNSNVAKFSLRNDVVHKSIIRKFKNFYLDILKHDYPVLKDKRKKFLPKYANELEEYYKNYFTLTD